MRRLGKNTRRCSGEDAGLSYHFDVRGSGARIATAELHLFCAVLTRVKGFWVAATENVVPETGILGLFASDFETVVLNHVTQRDLVETERSQPVSWMGVLQVSRL